MTESRKDADVDQLAATYARPAGSRWTAEQWAAIAADGRHLLVAAAAGSGKTAVLVERIISRIADERNPLDVDALLVATFTKASAAEMKERIRAALELKLEEAPASVHLRRQLALLPRASITTLHSFCMETVQRYAPLIGLDPGFRIANETEAELLRMDTLDELFEARYEQELEQGEEGELAVLADLYGGQRSDEPLHRLVLELFDFSRSHPWPDRWLRDTAAAFDIGGEADLASSPWVQSMRADVLLALSGAEGLLRGARDLAAAPGGPQPYASTLAEDAALVAALTRTVNARPWTEWREAFASADFGRLKACRGDGYDPELQERVKRMRDEAKKTVTKLKEEWFVRSPAQYAEELAALAPRMREIAELVIAFGDEYEAAKRDKGLLDFGDLEHYALRILRSPDSSPDRIRPSDAALAYRERFREILLDEYQDTNEVQEAIVSLIARSEPGNVFMVGDVKQSIYGFRLAEPGLFLAKYKSYDVWTPQGPECAADAGDRSVDGREEDGVGRGVAAGLRIDLARNFRSRSRVLDAVNHVFRLIMREPVGEMDYDLRAELIYGEGYPEEAAPAASGTEAMPSYSVEMLLIDSGKEDGKTRSIPSNADADAEAGGAAVGDSDGIETEEEELESAQLEARCIAAEIARLTGTDGSGRPPFAVYEGRSGLHRPLAYRDIVILLRAATSLAPVVLDELRAAGIPAYADLATGYFSAVEVDVTLSLLHIIDNPDQDIPLAGVLRSPIGGLSADELAAIRIADRAGSFWSAVRTAAGTLEDRPLRAKLARFVEQLEGWRSFARREPLGELLHALYRDTGYFDFVGGLPGGAQRQANLRALIDRARQYERNSSYRGLFRFLRFLGRMRDTGGDLGAARAVGEQEDVVRVVSIHKSKGLEFPVVFAAGLGRRFNRQDLTGMFLRHKKLGFGPRMVERVTRIAYPTLPQLAIRRRMKAELLAEEMRVLYVALTRPKEKLILVGTTKNAAGDLDAWRRTAEDASDRLPDHAVAAAGRYLDWLGPASILSGAQWLAGEASTDAAEEYAAAAREDEGPQPQKLSARAWSCRIVPSRALLSPRTPDRAAEEGEPLWNLATRLEPLPGHVSPAGEAAYAALSWEDPHAVAARSSAKTSITAMKSARDFEAFAGSTEAANRQALGTLPLELPVREAPAGLREPPVYDALPEHEAESDGPDLEEMRHPAWNPEEVPDAGYWTYRLRRPRFMSARRMSAAERGTAVHLVMQHLPLGLSPDRAEAEIESLLERLAADLILTPEQRDAAAGVDIAGFCKTELYARMSRAGRLWREWPFSAGLPAAEAHPASNADELTGETVLIQGVLDCLFDDGERLVLVDYKTDAVPDGDWQAAAEKHRFQMEMYARAIEGIMGRKVGEGHIYFVEGGVCARLY
ncbi:UvrD-helicase domain-containing protein [Cohnella sp. JJ-181]|uniref:UvrD-helicase domain-containing protein n=1 Tax=Cohnella rhizoplanae TaxID=2974897 RepID=UPI0022FFADB0|nr:UvrD-helicase domain-containing protein [Cohnella sp. JJ-181]CAI6017977.1 ATP-dependent helicase/nuclease subunit A [Cohnella sp. JJ-181]